MASIKSNYLGLEMTGPVIVSSSPFTASLDHILKLEEHGAGAVVLKSIFEEQIEGETSYLEKFNDYPEAADYLKAYVGDDYLKGHVEMIRQAKKQVRMPVIASINCVDAGRWTDYARRIEEAGADALELNIFIMPAGIEETAADIEARYMEIMESVKATVSIPVSVKLGIRFTNVLNVARELNYRGAKGVVFFNRFFEPDINVERMEIVPSDSMSTGAELRNSLRTVGQCDAGLPTLDISVSTGVYTPEDVVKAILAGAKGVQVCSTLYKNGLGFIGQANEYLETWMLRHSFNVLDDFRGRLNEKTAVDPALYERAQFMKFFPRK